MKELRFGATFKTSSLKYSLSITLSDYSYPTSMYSMSLYNTKLKGSIGIYAKNKLLFVNSL